MGLSEGEGGKADSRERLRAYAEFRANLTLCHVCGCCYFEDFANLIERALYDAISKIGEDIDLDEITFEVTCGGCSDTE